MSALAELRRGRPDLGWRAIESAPKDGTRIIIYVRKYEEVVFGYWLQRKSKKAKSGWRCLEHPYFLDDDGEFGFGVPTHWMPIPAPPK